MTRALALHLHLRGCCKALPPMGKETARLKRRVEGVLRDEGQAVQAVIQQSANRTATQLTEAVLREVRDVKWTEQMIEAVQPSVERLIHDGGVRGAQMVGTQFRAGNPEVQRFVESQVTRLAEDVTNGTQTMVSDLLGTRLQEGESLQVIARDLRDRGFSPVRAEAIARTESARAQTGGQLESWRQAPFLVQKLWKASINACQFCDALEIKYGRNPIPLDKPFVEVGETIIGTEGGTFTNNYGPVMGPALHPNCTCVLSAHWERTEDDEDA